ncbi:hypothetical protein FJZ27_00460 [Candidatus Peribacteria bacterium]|nr:hypothetical protein [Candidatus Peribacteria bacterium]
MVNRVDSGTDTRVVVTDHDGVIDCHIDPTGVEVAVAETIMESRRRAAEVCEEFDRCLCQRQSAIFALRVAASSVASRWNGI